MGECKDREFENKFVEYVLSAIKHLILFKFKNYFQSSTQPEWLSMDIPDFNKIELSTQHRNLECSDINY